VIVRSGRLYLRQATPEDAAVFFAMDNDPEVMRHIGDGHVTTDPAVTAAGLARVIAAYSQRPGLGLWACCLHDGGRCVGWCALKPCMLSFPVLGGATVPPATQHLELGYRLLRDAWGHGYATEMAIALLEYGFARVGVDEVIACCKPANIASARVMQKAGLGRVGRGAYGGTLVEVYRARRAAWGGARR
jgi:RimJ/RimL family protein N-acetyltransferase